MNGQTPLLAFVYRNPADAWFNGVQKRNQSADGHIVPDGVFANTHAVARNTFLKLVDEFGNKVQYIIKEVADGKSSEITIEELKNKPKYTKEQIKEAVNAESYSRAILDGFEKSEQSGNIQRIDGQRNSADGRSAGRRDRAVSAEQQAKVIPQKTPKNSDIKLSAPGDRVQNIEEVNRKFNDDLDRQIAGTLPVGYIHKLGTPGDILLSTGIPNLPIELSATRLGEKSETAHHPFDIRDVKDLPQMLQKPIGVFSYGDKNKAQNIIIEVQKDGKNFIVGLSLNFEHDGLVVNSIRGLYPKDLHEWLTWIQDGKSLYLNKEKIQNLIDQQRRNLADVEYLNLDSINNIIQNFQNPSVSEKNSEKNSGELKLSTPGDRGDTSLDPVDYRRSIDPLFDFFMEYSDIGRIKKTFRYNGWHTQRAIPHTGRLQ